MVLSTIGFFVAAAIGFYALAADGSEHHAQGEGACSDNTLNSDRSQPWS
jgi:hypothetical protein